MGTFFHFISPDQKFQHCNFYHHDVRQSDLSYRGLRVHEEVNEDLNERLMTFEYSPQVPPRRQSRDHSPPSSSPLPPLNSSGGRRSGGRHPSGASGSGVDNVQTRGCSVNLGERVAVEVMMKK